MATNTTNTPANVLTFPKRNKGRVRKSNSLQAMGETALRVLLHWGHTPKTASVARPFRVRRSEGEEAFEALLADVVSLPRPLIDHLVARCIGKMDEIDGDPDREDDDPTEGNGDEQDYSW